MTRRPEAAADAAAVSRSDAPSDKGPVQPPVETSTVENFGVGGPPDKRDVMSPVPPPPGTDHDGDGRMGGMAPIPEIQHLVVIAADETRGLQLGDVIGAPDALVRELLHADVARPATETEVELAQPRVRILNA